MFSKILPLTDETTEDQPGTRAERVGGADRRSLPPPADQVTLNHWSDNRSVLESLFCGGGRRTRPASAKPRTVSEGSSRGGKPRAWGAASSGPPVSGFD